MFMFIYIYIYIYIYIVVTTKEFSENKVLNIVNVELLQLRLHLLLHVVTLCYTYADDDDGLQTGAEDGWVYIYIYIYRKKEEVISKK